MLFPGDRRRRFATTRDRANRQVLGRGGDEDSINHWRAGSVAAGRGAGGDRAGGRGSYPEGQQLCPAGQRARQAAGAVQAARRGGLRGRARDSRLHRRRARRSAGIAGESQDRYARALRRSPVLLRHADSRGARHHHADVLLQRQRAPAALPHQRLLPEGARGEADRQARCPVHLDRVPGLSRALPRVRVDQADHGGRGPRWHQDAAVAE